MLDSKFKTIPAHQHLPLPQRDRSASLECILHRWIVHGGHRLSVRVDVLLREFFFNEGGTL